MSAQGVRLLPETIRERTAISFTGSYQTIGTPISNASRILKFVNNSNVDVMISWDGTNDHDMLPANSAFILDVAANRQAGSSVGQLYIADATQFYVSGAAGGGNTGSVYLITMYA